MKIRREYSERRSQILDVAENLFSSKGYEKCSVNHILDEIGIAKGTFYYYFNSKEEVLDGVIDRINESILERAREISENTELSPVVKLIHVILAMRVKEEVDNRFLEKLHNPENALLHQKSLVSILEKIIPILDTVVEEGIREGIFKSEFPREYMKIFLTASLTLLDEGIFQVSEEEQQKNTRALVALLEKMLGVEDEIFWTVVKQYYMNN